MRHAENILNLPKKCLLNLPGVQPGSTISLNVILSVESAAMSHFSDWSKCPAICKINHLTTKGHHKFETNFFKTKKCVARKQ